MSGQDRASFRGSSAAEAEDFVQAVRRTAWAEQKQFDYAWMAAYAAALMSGPALRWHMGLPRDVQGDWRKMEVALLDRFAPDQPLAAPSNDPTVPSGAPVAPTLCFGRIRVTETNTGRFVGYMANNIAKEDETAADVSKQFDDALVVQFTPSSSPVTFDLVDQSSFHRLALRKFALLELTTSSYGYLNLICFAPGPKPGSIRYSCTPSPGTPCHVQHAVWKVGADGCITAIWPPSPQISIGTAVDTTGNPPILMFFPNIEDQFKNDYTRNSYTRVRLEFEHA